MNVQRVERITDLMRHTGSQHCKSRKSLHFDRLLRGTVGLSDVAQDDRATDRLAFLAIRIVTHHRNDIKIQQAIIRIKNLQIPAYDITMRAREGLPVNSSNDLIQRTSEAGLGLDSKKSTCGSVEIKNPSFGVRDNDAFKNCVEDCFEESLLSGNFDKIVLHLARLDERKTFYEFIEKSAFHDGLTGIQQR